MSATFEEWLNTSPTITHREEKLCKLAWEAASAHTKLHDNPKEHCRHVWLKYENLGSHQTYELRKQACADDGCYGMWCQADMTADQTTRSIGNRPPDRPKIEGKGYAT